MMQPIPLHNIKDCGEGPPW